MLITLYLSLDILLWCSQLWIWHCHHSGLDYYWGIGSIPGLGTSSCCGCGEKITFYLENKIIFINLCSPLHTEKLIIS